jgi:hypothetical protein
MNAAYRPHWSAWTGGGGHDTCAAAQGDEAPPDQARRHGAVRGQFLPRRSGGRAYRAASAVRSGSCVLADSLARSTYVDAKPMHSSARA